MLKGILDKLFQSNSKRSEPSERPISQAEVEAIVSARLKEHAATIEKSIADHANTGKASGDQEDFSLTPKQMEFALDLIAKTKEYVLAMNPENLTVKDLNKFIAYNRYKNKGILINLAKKVS